MTNVGTGSTLHMNDSKFSHTGSGDYHCLTIVAGTANIDTSETSGTTVGAFGISGGAVNITGSDIQTSGSYAIELAGGTLSVANSKITTTAANSIGIMMSTGTAAVIGNVSFSVPASLTTGRAISGVSGSILYYAALYFLPDGIGGTTNSKIDTVIARTVISTTITLA